MTPVLNTASNKTGSQASRPGQARPRPRGWTLYLLVALAVASAIGMFMVESRELIGVLGISLMLWLIFLRLPIALATIVPGVLGMWALRSFKLVASTLSSAPYGDSASWSYSVIPMFIFMGMLLGATNLTDDLFIAVRRCLWWLPGGLAVGTNMAGTGLAAVSGSTTATTYTLGRVSIPAMMKAGYSPRMALVSLMAAGLPGQLIPPSILLIIYAGLVEVPVGPQLLSGVIPGVLISVVFSLIFIGAAIVLQRRGGGALNRADRRPIGESLISVIRAWPAPVLIVVVIGGMVSGVFTATEAAGAAATISLVLALLHAARTKSWKAIAESMWGTLSTTGMIFFLLIGAMILSDMLTLTGITSLFADWVSGVGLDRWGFLLVMIVVYLILGMGMESLPMMVLTVPVLMPTLAALDISLVWFGVFVVIMGELAILSPPVGVLLYMIHSMTQDRQVNAGVRFTLRDVFMAVLYVLPGALLVLLALIAFPGLAEWLPSLAAR